MGLGWSPGFSRSSSRPAKAGTPTYESLAGGLLTESPDIRKNFMTKAFRAFAWVMRHPRIYELGGMAAASLAPSSNGGWIKQASGLMSIGPLRAWLSQRDLPAPPAKSFRQMWRER